MNREQFALIKAGDIVRYRKQNGIITTAYVCGRDEFSAELFRLGPYRRKSIIEIVKSAPFAKQQGEAKP